MSRASLGLACLFTATIAPSTAHAFLAGVFGFSGKPPAQSCSGCHSGGPTPTVALRRVGGPEVLAPGESGTYELDIVTGASARHAGWDIAASDGTLAVVAGQPNESYVNNGELTHNKNAPAGETVALKFTFTAPAQTGPVTLFATGLSTDGADNTANDAQAATTLEIKVADPTPPPDLLGLDLFGVDLAEPPDLSEPLDAISSATQVDRPSSPDLGPPRNEPTWSCDCNLTPHPPPTPLALLLLAAALLFHLRRR